MEIIYRPGGIIALEKIEYIIDAIKNNWNDIILWADSDMQFFGKCTEIKKLVEITIK